MQAVTRSFLNHRWAMACIAAAALAACGGGDDGKAGVGFSGAQMKVGQSAATSLPGAIFTTASTCETVNGNIYPAKEAVYLNGGPERPGSAGLIPNTAYYVKVTDPSGAQVLGTSGTTRPVSTNNLGNFVQCYQLQDIVYVVPEGATAPGTDKGFRDTPNAGGEYKVWVSTEADFPNDKSKTDNFKVRSGPIDQGDASVTVKKFYDANANGDMDGGEQLLESTGDDMRGWKVDLTGFETGDYFTTFTFNNVITDTVLAREYRPLQTNWYPTNAYVNTFTGITPPSSNATILNQISVPLSSDTKSATVYFGNLCVGAGNGRTLGYWSNKNGEADLKASTMREALAALSALNLVTARGDGFDPATYTPLRNWLLDGNAVNMAYMLSVQLAAMRLNVFTGKVSESALVYAPGSDSANAAGFATIGALIAEANDSLALAPDTTSRTPAGYLYRDYQALLKTALDSANNNRTFVQPSAANCPYLFTLSTPPLAPAPTAP